MADKEVSNGFAVNNAATSVTNVVLFDAPSTGTEWIQPISLTFSTDTAGTLSFTDTAGTTVGGKYYLAANGTVTDSWTRWKVTLGKGLRYSFTGAGNNSIQMEIVRGGAAIS